jgi:hypothetical protein
MEHECNDIVRGNIAVFLVKVALYIGIPIWIAILLFLAIV